MSVSSTWGGSQTYTNRPSRAPACSEVRMCRTGCKFSLPRKKYTSSHLRCKSPALRCVLVEQSLQENGWRWPESVDTSVNACEGFRGSLGVESGEMQAPAGVLYQSASVCFEEGCVVCLGRWSWLISIQQSTDVYVRFAVYP